MTTSLRALGALFLVSGGSQPAGDRPMTTSLRALGALFLVSASAAAQDFVTTFDEVSAPGPFSFVFPGLANGPQLDYPEIALDGGFSLSEDGTAEDGT